MKNKYTIFIFLFLTVICSSTLLGQTVKGSGKILAEVSDVVESIISGRGVFKVKGTAGIRAVITGGGKVVSL